MSVLLHLLPVLVLVALFWLRRGRVPGEGLLVRAVERARRRTRSARVAAPALRWTPLRAPAGGVLLALSLAGRAPPVAA